jgi:hypothetical protein
MELAQSMYSARFSEHAIELEALPQIQSPPAPALPASKPEILKSHVGLQSGPGQEKSWPISHDPAIDYILE